MDDFLDALDAATGSPPYTGSTAPLAAGIAYANEPVRCVSCGIEVEWADRPDDRECPGCGVWWGDV